ncbi:thiamine biosynthesis protein ThiS [Hydrogenophilus thermoluteolus]|jgi:sulfur carrier protein|uniref:sulfur carrier protein ThiS n=1 Tax=Hydrogenophilus thermoluteolus TaxID=297 RepID=UPI0024A1B367|nr:sulfur carrier protein ThiS [Hydrogenophilus thermoluteolus]GLW61047.1 thiamine biosynthesis protein ThiS [Hydrogenophilus thermoluteolus]
MTDTPATLTLRLNGALQHVPAGTTVSALLARHGWLGKRVAVERNGEIVPKSAYETTVLRDGDVLEIVVAVGGG